MAVATNYETFRWKGAIEPDEAGTDTGNTTALWKGAIEPQAAVAESNASRFFLLFDEC